MKITIKRILAIFLSIVMMLGMMPVSVFAVETRDDTAENKSLAVTQSDEVTVLATYTCGDNLTATLTSDWTLTISGTGDMYDFMSVYDSSWYFDLAPWTENRFLIKKVVIEDGVTSIGKYAFQECQQITEIILPEGLTSIGNGAFYACRSMKSITIPSSLKSVEEFVFFGCSALTGVYISDLSAWCEIEYGEVFYGNRYYTNSNPLEFAGNLYLNNVLVKDLVIPENVNAINDYVFYGCTSITSVTIHDDVTSVGFGAFSCENLTDVYISDLAAWCEIDFGDGNLLGSKGKLYVNNELVTELIIPDGVTSIGDYAFDHYKIITSVTIPDSVTSIGNKAFYDCDSLTDVNIMGGVETIGESAFASCEKLTDVTLPNTVESFGNKTFAYCTSLVSITIPDSVISIGDEAFSNCTSLNNIIIPNNVTNIGIKAFYNCINLESIILSNKLESINENVFENCTRLEKITIPDSVNSVGRYAFNECGKLTSVVVGNNVEIIGSYAFNNCGSLTEIALSEALTSISAYVFNGCESLESITIPAKVATVEMFAFRYCKSLNEVIFLGDAPNIDLSAFSGIKATCYYSPNDTWTNEILTNDFGGDLIWTYEGEETPDDFNKCGKNVTWELAENGTLTISGTGAMYDYSIDDLAYAPWYEVRTLITAVQIGDGITRIGDAAFYSCTNLKSVSMADTVLTIGDHAFDGCSVANDFELSENLVEIGSHSFANCKGVTAIELPANLTKIGEYAFYRCYKLQNIVLPDGLEVLENGTFQACIVLYNVTFPRNLKIIENNVFDCCYKLNSVILPEGLISIGNGAFAQAGDKTVDGYSFNSVTLPSTIKSIGNGAFGMCRSLTSINLPEGLETIGRGAFNFCTGLKSIEIPASVTNIEEMIFYNATSLKEVKFKGNAPSFNMDENADRYYTFSNVTATCYYPANNETWTADVMQNYGGKLTWLPMEMEEEGPGGGSGGNPGEEDGEDSGESGGNEENPDSGETEGGGNEGGSSGNEGGSGESGGEGSGTGGNTGGESGDGSEGEEDSGESGDAGDEDYGTNVVKNDTTGKLYEDISIAISEAENGETIKLVNDCEAIYLMIPEGVTIDLNGYKLTLTGRVFVCYGSVIDETDGKGGIAIASSDFAHIQSGNTYLSVYDTENGCYRFFTYEMKSRGVNAVSGNTDAAKYGYTLYFNNAEAYALLATGENTNLNMSISLSWTGMSNAISYIVPSATLIQFANTAEKQMREKGKVTAALTFTVKGLNNLESGTVVYSGATIASTTNVTMTSETVGYTVA